MSDNSATRAVIDNEGRHRFELPVDGQVVFASYRREPGHWVITYVEAPPALRGTGAAGRLMQGVLDEARARGVTVTPLCDYARAYMKRHPQYADLFAPDAL
ncbi:MAG: N-acetyltransferase [Caulobacteraceae bacterium]|nr:N-acetyltransferase [Caulobacteraceae bacterium]